MESPKVLIAGAGPTGLVLALWLARDGVPFRIVDRKPGPGEGSRAMAVQARTIEFYRQLGIAGELLANGFQLEQLRLRNGSGEFATIPLGNAGKGLSHYPFALSYSQDDHERMLIASLRAAGHEVEWNTELTGFTQRDEGVSAGLQHASGQEENWQGLYLCGCDGAHSIVRHGMGVGFPGGTYEQLFFVADAEADGPWSDNEIQAFVAARVFCIAFPVRTPGQFRFIGLVPESLGRREEVEFDELRENIERVMGRKITRLNWFSTYRVHHRVAERFRQGRAFLAGDAGHIHSPAGGQGMNTGIGDAVNLAWKLSAVLRETASENVLGSYEAERMPFARSLVRTTDRIFEGVVGRSCLARTVRTIVAPVVLPLALRFQAVRRAQFRLVSQTRIAYRSSPLSDGSVGDVHAGDRLPWVEGLDNFAPLTARDWQIHVYGTAPAGLGEEAHRAGLSVLEWPWNEAARTAGLQRDAVYLVRPDGHVGFAREEWDAEAFWNYLRRFAIGSQRVSSG